MKWILSNPKQLNSSLNLHHSASDQAGHHSSLSARSRSFLFLSQIKLSSSHLLFKKKTKLPLSRADTSLFSDHASSNNRSLKYFVFFQLQIQNDAIFKINYVLHICFPPRHSELYPCHPTQFSLSHREAWSLVRVRNVTVVTALESSHCATYGYLSFKIPMVCRNVDVEFTLPVCMVCRARDLLGKGSF